MEIIPWLAGLGTVPNGFNFVVNYFHRRNWGGGARKGKYLHPSIFLPKDIFLTAELKSAHKYINMFTTIMCVLRNAE